MTQADLAARWGEPPSMYWDLELYDDEAFNVISVNQLSSLAAVLGISVMRVLFGEDPSPPLPLTTYSEVITRLRAKMAAQATSVDQMSDMIGWELEPFLDDPRRLEELPIFALRWVCKTVGVDWVTTLANTTPA